MYTGIKHLHSYFAYIVLIVLIVAVIYHLISYLGKKEWTKSHKTTASLGMMLTHTQLLFGIIMYIVSPYGIKNLGGEAMSDSLQRLYAIEHPLMNIIAIVLITIGYSRSKKQIGTPAAFKTIFIFYGIGLLFILSRIPWQVWLN